MPHRRVVLKNLVMSAALALAAAAGHCGLAQAQTSEVRVGLQAVPPDEVYRAKDFGKPYDLKLDLSSFSSAADSLKAFLAGRVDVANGGSARLVTMAAMQPDTFYIIAANQYGGDRYGVIVRTDSPYKTIQDLKGKKLGAVAGSGTFNTFRVFLEKNGLKESDFQIVNMKVEDLRAAVQRGIIDGAVAWEPHVAIAEKMGDVKRIVSMAGVNESPNFVLVSRAFADKNPDAVVKYVATLIDLANFIKTQPAEAGKLAAANLSKAGVAVDPAAIELALTRIKMDPEVTDALLEELVPVAQSMAAAGKIPAVPSFKALVRPEFYQKAIELAHAKHAAN